MQWRIVGLAVVALGLASSLARAQAPLGRPAFGPGNATVNAPRASGDPIVLRQTSFNIPITLNPAAKPPREIQLYVSTDRGASWRIAQRVEPAAGVFTFRAAGDGEYWFALRTVEADGRVSPPGATLRPGLRVVLDTAQPQLEFDATVGAAGEVKTSWRVTDASLAPESLKIEYQPTLGGPWQAIAVERPAGRDTSGSTAGQMTWWPDTTSRVIHVRAEISDRAANKTVVSRRLFLPRVAARKPEAQQSGTASLPNPASRQPSPGNEEGLAWLPEASSSAPLAGATRETGTAEPAGEWLVSTPRNPVDTAANSPDAARQAPAEPPPGRQGTLISNPFYASGRTLTNTGAYPAVPGGAQPPVGSQVAPEESRDNTAAPPAANDAPPVLPVGERPRMTNVRQFELEYDVDGVGPAGVAEVQLWGTSDNGQTWSQWQTDADRQSPLNISVPGDGVYGFRVIVVGINGLAGRAPQSGELADLWVGVDTAAPKVRLTSAVYGEGAHAGQLDIRWEASDSWLTDRPVTILFSENANGPWSTVASGLPNTGQYYWSVEARIPEKIYLRTEVRDEAGNVGEFQLSEPVSTTGLVPQARIRGLRPAESPPKTTRLDLLPRLR